MCAAHEWVCVMEACENAMTGLHNKAIGKRAQQAFVSTSVVFWFSFGDRPAQDVTADCSSDYLEALETYL